MCTHPLSAEGGRGLNLLSNFQKGETWQNFSIFRGGYWQIGGRPFSGGGCNFYKKINWNLKYLMTKKLNKQNCSLSKLRIQTGEFIKAFSYLLVKEGIRMESFSIMVVHWKIWNQFTGREIALKGGGGGAWTVCRFKTGLDKKRGSGIFEGKGGEGRMVLFRWHWKLHLILLETFYEDVSKF